MEEQKVLKMLNELMGEIKKLELIYRLKYHKRELIYRAKYYKRELIYQAK